MADFRSEKNFKSSGNVTDGYDKYVDRVDGVDILRSKDVNDLANSVAETQKALVDGYATTDMLPAAVSFEDGQTLVYDSASNKMIAGASGDASFKIQSITDPSAVIKSGFLILDDGRELRIASDLTINLDTVLGNPADDTTYYLYINLGSLSSSTTTASGRVVYDIAEANFSLQQVTPEEVAPQSYIPLGVIHSADSGNTWSGTGSSFETLAFRRHSVGSQLSSSEINYIENSNAEFNTTGWITYADTAGLAPVDGTGGVSGVPFTRQSNVVLRGNQSFKISKDASDRQGEGVGYNFEIKGQDTSKKLKIQFDFKTDEDAGYANGDYRVYIYDVDNSTLITPTDVELIRGQNIFQTSFNSTNSLNYRLIFHCATDNESPYDIYIDNVIVGPGMTSQGAAIGPVEEYTLSLSDFNNATGLTIGSGRILYQRVGENMKINFFVRFGGTGSSASSLEWTHTQFFSSLGLGDAFTTAPSYVPCAFVDLGLGSVAGITFIQTGHADFYQYHVTDNTNRTLRGNDCGASGRVRDIGFEVMVPITEWQGKGIVPMLSEDNLSEGQSFTSVSNMTTNVNTDEGYWHRVGNRLRLQAAIEFSGTNTQDNVKPNLPAGYTVDTSQLPSFTDTGYDRVAVGNWVAVDRSGDDVYSGTVVYDVTSGDFFLGLADGTGQYVRTTTGVPFTIADDDMMSWIIDVPVVQFSGSQNSLVGYSLASETDTGLVSTGTQTFNGDKTIKGNLIINAADDNEGLMIQEAGETRMSFKPLGSLGAAIDFHKSGGSLNVRDDSGTELLTINETGNIGIGVSSPSVNLDVRASSGTTKFHLSNATDSGKVEIESVVGLGGYVNLFQDDNTQSVKLRADGNTYFNGGNVGIGTSSPSKKLHIVETGVSPASTFGQLVVENSGSSVINMISDNSGSNAIYFGDQGSFARGAIFYDHSTEKLEFRTATNSARMTIHGPNVGIGKTSPSQNLDIKEDNNGDCAILVENLNTGTAAHSRLGLRANGGICYLFKNSTNRTAGGGTDSFTIQNNANGVYLSAGATSWSSVSDMRYKTKLDDFTGGLGKLMGLSTFTYTLDEDESETKYVHLGMSAQEVLPKIPEVITGDSETKMGISYSRLVPVLINAVQEQQEIIEDLKARIEILEGN